MTTGLRSLGRTARIRFCSPAASPAQGIRYAHPLRAIPPRDPTNFQILPGSGESAMKQPTPAPGEPDPDGHPRRPRLPHPHPPRPLRNFHRPAELPGSLGLHATGNQFDPVVPNSGGRCDFWAVQFSYGHQPIVGRSPSSYSKIGASFANTSSMTTTGTVSSFLAPRARRSSARG